MSSRLSYFILLAQFYLFFHVINVVPANALIVDHSSVDAVQGLPQETMDFIATKNWFFTHASVGVNIISGLNELALVDPSRYKLTVNPVDFDAPPEPGSEYGVVYEINRGNPHWTVKLSMFEDAIRQSNWCNPVVNIVANKFCYIDHLCDPQAYIASMTSLEEEFPLTVFMYMTMPITSITDNSANVDREIFNLAVRDFCQENGKLLLDIADIESHDPEGNPYSYHFEGSEYPILYSGYTTDGGHLNSLGAQRVALGWYAAVASLLSNTTSIPHPSHNLPLIRDIVPNPFNPRTTLIMEIPSAGVAEVLIFNARGHLIMELFQGYLTPGTHELIWKGVDSNGMAVGSGVYFVRLNASGQTSTRRMTLIR